MATLDGVDIDDPCALARALRSAYLKLIAGDKVASVSLSTGNGSEQSTTFHKTSLAELRAELRRAEAECQARQSGRPQRFALATGGRGSR